MGLVSLMLNESGQRADWVRPVQSVLLIIFLVGAAVIILSRFPPEDRKTLRIALTPSLLAISLGLFFPAYMPFFGVAGMGWPATAFLNLRGSVRQGYTAAPDHRR